MAAMGRDLQVWQKEVCSWHRSIHQTPYQLRLLNLGRKSCMSAWILANKGKLLAFSRRPYSFATGALSIVQRVNGRLVLRPDKSDRTFSFIPTRNIVSFPY